jgi:hypothetical protein
MNANEARCAAIAQRKSAAIKFSKIISQILNLALAQIEHEAKKGYLYLSFFVSPKLLNVDFENEKSVADYHTVLDVVSDELKALGFTVKQQEAYVLIWW